MSSPFSLKKLGARVVHFLRESGDTSSESRFIEAGDFRIDLQARRVFLRGHEIELTAAEFDLLLFLNTHRKKIVTSHTLLTTRCSENQVRRTEFLTVLIGLQRKLELGGSTAHYIRTEPWILYRFDPGA